MSLKTRQKLYNDLAKLRNKPNICYVTSIKPNINASISSDAILPIIDGISSIPKTIDDIDFIIISNGGDAITAIRIMSILRERFKNVSVLLPYVAYSAATIFALGADEIVMHPFSNLGPVDSQITVVHNNEKGQKESKRFSSEDIRNYIEFIKTDLGIKKSKCLTTIAESLVREIPPSSIGFTRRSQHLSLSLSEKMLGWHSKNTKKNRNIAQKLTSEYYSHGYALGRIEAKNLGLQVVIPDSNVENVLWKIWNDIRIDMCCDNTFNPLKEIMSDEKAIKELATIPVLNVPNNLPLEIKNQIYQNIMLNANIIQAKSTITRDFLIAIVESENFSKSVYQNINISYWRNQDMKLNINTTMSPTGWINNKEVI